MAKLPKNKKRIVLIILAAFTFLVIANEVLIVGNIPYLIKWHECGNRPYVSTVGWSIGFGAQPVDIYISNQSDFFDTKTVSFLTESFQAKMSCTLDEAKASYTDGYYDIHLEVN